MAPRFRNVFADPNQDTDPITGGFRRSINQDNPPDDTGTGSVTEPPVDRKKQQDDIYEQTLRALSTPGANQTKYANFVANAPKEADFNPNMYTRIAAAIAGAGAGMRNPEEGVRVAQQIRDDPYNTAVKDYKLRGEGLGVLAQQEESTRAQQLGLVRALREDAYKSRDMTNKETETGIKQQEATTMAGYRKAQEEDMKRKGWVFYDDDKGNRIGTLMGASGQQQKVDFGPSMAATTSKQKDRELGQADARNATYGRMAGAAEKTAGANEQRAGQSFSPPSQQFYADSLATQAALRENPNWGGFVDSNGKIKTSFHFGDISKNKGYKDFLDAVERNKQNIIKNNRSGSPFGSMFDIKDDEQ